MYRLPTNEELKAIVVDGIDDAIDGTGEPLKRPISALPVWADLLILEHGIKLMARAGWQFTPPPEQVSAEQATAFAFGQPWTEAFLTSGDAGIALGNPAEPIFSGC